MDASGRSDLHWTGDINGEHGSASCDRGIMAHDPQAIMTVDRSSPNRTVRIFRVEIPLKTDVLLFFLSTLD